MACFRENYGSGRERGEIITCRRMYVGTIIPRSRSSTNNTVLGWTRHDREGRGGLLLIIPLLSHLPTGWMIMGGVCRCWMPGIDDTSGSLHAVLF